MGRTIRLALQILLLAAAVLAVLGAALPGGTKEVARGSGEILRLEAHDAGLLWLEAPRRAGQGGAPRTSRRILFLARGAARPSVLAEGPGITDFSVRDALYYLTTDAASSRQPPGSSSTSRTGSLLRVALQGGAPVVLRTGLERPTTLLSLDGWLCWAETQPPPAFSLPVLPLTRSLTRLQAIATGGGGVHTLSVSDGGAGGVALRLLGEHDGYLYWLERRTPGRLATLVKRARLPAASGSPGGSETLASEEGEHEGLVAGGMLFWTGASWEGGPPWAFTSVIRRSPDGRLAILGDWLWPEGVVRADGDRVYYCQNGVWDLPGDAGAARQVVALRAPGRLTQIVHGNAYAVEQGQTGGYRIVREPLHWGGRWAAIRGAVP
jgi:hypothetical protein